MQYDFFLSYRRSDQPLARRLAAELEARGAKVFWDDQIEGGEDWREAIASGIEASTALVILFSEGCNTSKQLRKELALADMLNKLIIPVLIEKTTPKGHFLYELAALNWLQVYPQPEQKMPELSERLIAELAPGRAERGGVVHLPVSRPEADAGRSPPRTRERAPRAAPGAPRKARLDKPEQKRRNFLAFKWYELLIAAMVAGLAWLGSRTAGGTMSHLNETQQLINAAMVMLLVLILIAVIVFPFRYYFRRLRVTHALSNYLGSVWTLSGLLGVLSAFHPDLAEQTFDVGTNIVVYVIAWGLITLAISIVAFAIYGVLHFQRTLRRLKSNTEVIEPSKASLTFI